MEYFLLVMNSASTYPAKGSQVRKLIGSFYRSIPQHNPLSLSLQNELVFQQKRVIGFALLANGELIFALQIANAASGNVIWTLNVQTFKHLNVWTFKCFTAKISSITSSVKQ